MTTTASSPSSSRPASSNEDLQRLLVTPRVSRYCPHGPTEQQTVALIAHRFLPDDEPSEVFYGGAAGGGKSDWLLMGALEYVDVPGYSAILFRRTFTDLELPGAIMDRARTWLSPYIQTGEVRWSDQKKRFTFPSGAKLQFAYLKDEGDELRYQSAEFQYVGFDELTQFPEGQYEYLFSRLRRPENGPLSYVPLRMRAASNPGGPGHGWVKRRFPIDGKPRTGGKVFIPAKIADNPHLDATAYRASLSRLGETLQKQLEDGDWDVAEGLAFEIRPDHLIDKFPLADAMERFEAADYGLNGAPWGLWPVDYEGNVICFDMLYEEQLLPSQLAPLILAKRKAGWGFDHPAYVDPSVWHRTGTVNQWGQPAMLADEFSDNGVPIKKANPDPRAGLIRVREMLRLDKGHSFPNWHPRAGEPGSPRLFFVKSRTERLREELTSAPLQPIDRRDGGEIVEPDWESRHGHAVAMTRYAVMTRPAPSTEPPPEELSEEDRRLELLSKHRGQRGKTGPGRYTLT